MNQVFVCSSYFHLYVSILRTLNAQDVTAKNLVIINNHIPEFDKVIPILKENGFFDHHLSVPLTRIGRQKKNSIQKIFRRKILIHQIDSDTDILKFEDFIRNAEINVFNNQGPAYIYFLRKFKKSYIRLMEDGLGNYYELIGKFTEFKRRYILRTIIGAGLDDQIKEIFVQHPEKVIDRLKPKARKLDLEKMLGALSNTEKNKIFNVFMQGISINLSGTNSVLLLTQAVDNYMSEEQKISIYNQLLSHYATTHTIFIKPHPRETTDYAKVLNYPVTIIPKSFPVEMLDLLDETSFDVGLTICSSSLNNLKCLKKRVFLGIEYLKKPIPENWYVAYE